MFAALRQLGVFRVCAAPPGHRGNARTPWRYCCTVAIVVSGVDPGPLLRQTDAEEMVLAVLRVAFSRTSCFGPPRDTRTSNPRFRSRLTALHFEGYAVSHCSEEGQ